jgi:hypothetical protein
MGLQVRWHRSLEEVPRDAPAIFIAHEFFDALPVHQFQKTERGWCERLVDVAGHCLLPPLCKKWLVRQRKIGELRARRFGVPAAQKLWGSLSKPIRRLLDWLVHRVKCKSRMIQGTQQLLLEPWMRKGAGEGQVGAHLISTHFVRYSPKPLLQPLRKAFTVSAGPDSSLHFQMVLSPGPTPASKLLIPRRLQALAEAESELLRPPPSTTTTWHDGAFTHNRFALWSQNGDQR